MIYVRQEISSFTYSNIISTVPDYDENSEYMLGDLVRVGNYEYKSLFGTVELPNKGNNPLTSQGVNWFLYGSSNLYACIDQYSETRTTWEGDGILEFTKGAKDTIALGYFTARYVTIQYLDSLNNVIDTDSYTFNFNEGVNSPWTYGYAGFTSFADSNIIYYQLKRKGAKIRITLSNGNSSSTSLGYLIAGKSNFTGLTIDKVSFPDKRIGNKTVKVGNFETIIGKTLVLPTADAAKKLINEPMLFIIDESLKSKHQNILILGKINKCEPTASNFEKNSISWEIEQNILI